MILNFLNFNLYSLDRNIYFKGYIMRIIFTLIILFTIHCSLFTAYAQSWQELMDSTKFYQEKQDYQTALQLAQKALPQVEKEFCKLDTNYASTIGSIAELFYYSGKLDSAIYYQEIHLKLCRTLFRGDHPDLANSINNLAMLYNARGNYNEAEPLYKEALEMSRRLFKGDNPDLANIINSIAYFNVIHGRYSEAEPLFKEALEMRRHIFKGDHPELAGSINNMAMFNNGQGRYADAEPLYKEALEMRRRLFNGDHPELAESINNMAAFNNGRGNYNEAEPLYKEALEMYRRIFKGDHPDLANSINNMAYFYNGRGNYNEAEPLYKEALEMRRRFFKGDHPDLAGSINNMALFYDDRGNYKDAEPLYKEGLEMSRHLFKGDHPELATSINNMAYFYDGRGNYNEAEPLYKEALEMRRRFFKGDHPDLANSINNMAMFYNERGRYSEAEPLYKEALEMRRRLFKGGHPYLSNSINQMASFYKRWGRYDDAEHLYLELMTVCYNMLNNYFPSLSEEEKGQYFNTFSKYYLQFNNFAFLRYKESPQILETMFDNQLLTKGMLLSSTNKVRSRILSSNDTTLIQLFNSWKDKKEYIAKLYLLSKALLEKKKINLDSIIKSANEQEKELTKRSEIFQKQYDMQKLNWKDVQKNLEKDEAIVEIVRINLIEKGRITDTVFYSALIVMKKSKEPELVLLKNGAELEKLYIKNYHNSIQNQLEDKDSYSQFWEPIAKKLKGIKTVYLSPDGVYNQINLATLMNPKTEHYLSDDVDIRVVTSTRDLVERKENPLNPPLKKGEMVVELFGDPMFNLDSTKHLELANAIAENRTREFYYLGNTLDSTTRGGIIPLPSTRTEIEQIANEFTKKGWNVNSHLGEKALEEAVKGVDNPRILHIATHGKFLKDIEIRNDEMLMGMETKRVAENPLLRSFLLFSGAENTLNNQKLENQNIDDGLLTAYEAMNLNLDKTDLVVLSACETGLGEIKNGEGVYGLQRAFQQAGAKSIIMSLWTVPDKETQELMTSFYSKWLNGKDKRTAFNEARNEMRDKYHYPYYWGGFVMVGE